jgi:hypothetical protein
VEHGGYIKLWRKLEAWLRERGATAAQKWTTVEMLLMANWQDEAGIPRGSFASSERDIASRAGVSRKVVRATQRLLEQGDEDGPFVTVSRRAHSGAQLSSIYTVENYDRWQGEGDEQGPTEGPGLGPGDTRVGPWGNHSPCIEEVKKEEEQDPRVARSVPTTPRSTTEPKRAPKPKSTPVPPEDLELLKHCERCLAELGAKGVALTASKIHLKAVRSARGGGRTQEQAKELLTRFYDTSEADDPRLVAAGYPLAWFDSRLAALLLRRSRRESYDPDYAPCKRPA